MNKENCALKLVDEIILYYDARSEKHQTAISNLANIKQKWIITKNRSLLNFLIILVYILLMFFY